MPKRVRTPPPAEDEPRFLTVMYPYPANANMELDQDRAECARWLASCIGKDVLYAMYHKPTAPNAIIIEVAREFAHWQRLLGEHKWADVFKKCDSSHQDWASQIFWCLFSSGREVQKHGWKRIDVSETWFRGWSLPNKVVSHPYPETHWCDVPHTDRTNTSICRPLPVATFPRPAPSVRPPPVGSPEWLRQKQLRAPDAKSAWGKGAPILNAPPPDAPNIRPTVRPSASNGSATDPSSSYRHGLPPLHTPYSSNTSSWGVPPGLGRTNSVPSTAGAGGSDDDEVIGNTPPASEAPDEFIAGGGLEDAMAGLSFASTVCEDEVDEDDEPILGVPASAIFNEPALEPEPVEREEWEGTRKPAAPSDEIICPAHGKLCSKGICIDYHRLKKGRERILEEENRRQALAEKKKQKKSKGKTVEPNTRDKVSYTVPRARPPHLNKVVPVENDESIDPGSTSEAATAPVSASASASASSPVEDAPATPVRSRPAHLMKSSANDTAENATAARPARGRRMNSNVTTPTSVNVPAPVSPHANDEQAANSKDGWGHIPRDPWGNASVKAPSDATVPASPSSAANGWGRVPRDPWGGESVNGDSVAGARSPPASTNDGWGYVPRDPWGGTSVRTVSEARGPPPPAPSRGRGRGGGRGTQQRPPVASRAPSAASSSAGGWGHVARDPWGGQSVGAPSVKQDDATTKKGKSVKKSWADQMEDGDNQSVGSSMSGWGRVSNGPWGS